ncbi:sugar phosphate isomerase/epimerase [Brevibacillus ruminantium]|uniref:Sugar phosphate isomerase/epimerase n=1 Tax=Brevibacillus ruminantium TaxID=2950604 RepID=A0ABY4WH76_9BACL|nr:sugar phosphate isomerase/epimerase family protein [Brevibacillus ruminantium]USG66219.1 sugar phosphate isomerase/epimerase [Brevibacillus ruminantium]
MLYVSSTLMWVYPVELAIEVAAHHGFSGVEVWAEHVWYHQSSAEKIRSAARKNGMQLSLHAASWDLNLCALNRGIREQSVREIKRSIELAEAIGAYSVTVHPGKLTLTNAWREHHLSLLAESLDELACMAHQKGLILSIEHIEPLPKELITTASALNQLRSELSYPTTATFDIAHVPLDLSAIQFYFDLLDVDKVHISDATKDKLHLPLGKGELDLEPILSLMKERAEIMVVEGLDTSRELPLLRENISYLERNEWLNTGRGARIWQ